jgi:hypothetical protein
MFRGIKIKEFLPINVTRIEITENVEFQSDPILMLLCFVIDGVTHENFMRELCLFYMTVHKMSRDARSNRDLIMYLVEMYSIMILLYLDIMTYASRRDLMIVSSRFYDIMISLYDCMISSRYNRAVSSRSWVLTNGGPYGKMPPVLIFSRRGLDIFSRLCYNTQSKITRIWHDYKGYKEYYKRYKEYYKRYKEYYKRYKEYYKRYKHHNTII